ncbi:hypothetical protein BGZ70_007766 [Mortierella alpina]|uniref:RING-type domain-containing protein n=1 Tax=Mortierella alpina TaxID=64518 RepID=A0A9P6M6T1_MORAP|nr:hypothetical protein BGZ70_007766 [Mortierella alpina]
MSSPPPPPPRQGSIDSNDRGTRRERIIYQIQNAEDAALMSLLHGREVVTRKATSLWTHFKDFIDNGNVLGLAVGLILGASFTSLVKSLVDDIISPPLGIALGQASLDNLFVVIKDGKNATEHYMTLEQAHDDGAVCIAYGRFIQMSFNFIFVAIVLFLMIRAVGIPVTKVDEYKTSSLCPRCDAAKRKEMRRVTCTACNVPMHRDRTEGQYTHSSILHPHPTHVYIPAITGISLMALQELDGYEDDYVFLPDIENDDYAPRIESTKATSIHSTTSLGQQQQQQHLRSAQPAGLEADDDEASDLDDIEEIEYGYDNDTLLIMPAMLRDYSHHATNYHPELWRAPNSDGQSSLARCRHEDRVLDRTELLKNSVPPTTCGICFETFTVFDLDPQPQDATTGQDEISPRAQFARSFTARLARSFALSSNSSSSENNHAESTPSISTLPLGSAPINPSRASTVAMNLATPSVSSRDIGIVMPCDHGLCLSCLQSFLTNAATQNQARFPTLCPQPGCRTPIPTESAELVLDPETLEIWYRKLAEIYVANKAQSQGGESEEDRAMLQLVRDRHWRHCPSCRFVIEKQQGCNHMVCHCGQSFCYKCGQPWNEMDARCSQDCESRGVHEDFGLDCNIM